MNIQISRADCSDIDNIIVLMQEHALFEEAELFTQNLDNKLANSLQGTPARLAVFLARTFNNNVGYCALTREFSSWRGEEYMHMDCLYIQATMRGNGIGALLMDAAKEFTNAQGITELQWQTPKWNEKAIKFYQKMGAHGLTKQRFTYNVGR